MTVIEAGGKDSFFIHDSVLVELCFILEFHNYAMKRKDIADAILTMAAVPQISIAPESWQALRLYQVHPKLDFTDCLLFVLGGAEGVYTFDRELQKQLLS